MEFAWQPVVTSWLLLFAGCVAILAMQRKIRSLHNNLSPGPHLDDLTLLMLATLLPALFANLSVVHILLVFVLCAALLLLWLDAVLVYLFGFEVNLPNMRIFFQGAEAFSGDSGELTRTFAKRSWFLTAPLATLCLLAASSFLAANLQMACHAAIATLVVLFLMAMTKSRFKWLFAPLLAGFVVLLTLGMSALVDLPLDWPFWQAILAAFITVFLVVANLLKKHGDTAFLRIRSPLRDFLRGSRMMPHPNIRISEADEQNHVFLPQAVPQPSDAFGVCRGANIILVTVESMSRDCIAPYNPDGALLPFLTKLSQTGFVSSRHYACCPNTNAAIQHLYQANYPVNDLYPFLPQLKKLGYSTTYMMISHTRYFRLNDILVDIGFDNILDRESEELDPTRGDYGFLDHLDTLNNKLGDGPFFLHIKNEQTHSPYQVVDRATFNRHSESSRSGRFANALEEADHVIESFITELGKKRNLDNTLIIYTGDHGQSFGELGYVSHSSSSVKQQVRVPFVMSHPALTPGQIERSSHFDVMPTLMDLLGITLDTPLFGRSLMHGAYNRPLLLHSKTRKGNAPSNCSLLNGQEKIMIDLIYGYRYLLDDEDNVIRSLSTEETRYYETLLYEVLQTRHLINNSIFMPRSRTHG